ncbi:MAG: hypothetical protein Kow0062_25430 [Acidobacteriota bacterium]
MADENAKTAPAAEPVRGADLLAAALRRPELAALPMTLSVRLARGRVPIGDLRRLAPGTVVRLETELGEPALLLAEGCPIGRGELAERRGELALRVAAFGADDE